MQTAGWSLPSGILSKALNTITVTMKKETKYWIGNRKPMETPLQSSMADFPAASLLVQGSCLKRRGGREQRVQKFFLFLA